jgi:hypothetical protein
VVGSLATTISCLSLVKVNRHEYKERQFPSSLPDLFMNTHNSDCHFANLALYELMIGHVEQDEAEKHEKREASHILWSGNNTEPSRFLPNTDPGYLRCLHLPSRRGGGQLVLGDSVAPAQSGVVHLGIMQLPYYWLLSLTVPSYTSCMPTPQGYPCADYNLT